MEHLSVTWTWRTRSPLHLGSGVSRAGVADRLVKRLPDGSPALEGDAVKGALRMGAEHVSAWLTGSASAYSYGQQPAEPTRWLLARVFGGKAVVHVGHGRFLGHRSQGRVCRAPRFQVLGATAIDPTSGAAKTNTYRRIEVLAKDALFRVALDVWVSSARERTLVASLLQATLATVESIGGRGAAGWGQVTVDEGSTRVCGLTDEEWVACGAPSAIADLEAALLEEGSGPAAPEREPAPSVTGSRVPEWFQLDITVNEPVCITSSPEISNAVSTELGVPASLLRGAVLAAWKRDAPISDDEVETRLGPKSRWLPALPVVNQRLAVPTPRYLVEPKRGGESARLQDGFSDEQPTEPMKQASAAWAMYDQSTNVWQPYREAVAQVDMHIARNYATGGKVSGALYSRAALKPRGPHPLRYRAWVHAPPDIWDPSRDLVISLGKRAASNGAASVKVSRLIESPIPVTGHPLETQVRVTLLAPASIREPLSGHPRRTLPADWWTEWATCEGIRWPFTVVPGKVRQATTRRGHFHSRWGHPRASAVLLDAGSVWSFQFTSTQDATAFVEWVTREPRQIGDRRHEGFGWFTAWLREPVAGDADVRNATADKGPESWPGVRLSAEDADRIAADVVALKPDELKQLRQPLRDVAAEARHQDSASLLVTIARLQDTPRPTAWGRSKDSNVFKIIIAHLEDDNTQALRLCLDLMLIRAEVER